MRELKDFLFISFNNTEDALKAESLYKSNQILGRLVPTPEEIDASCGLSWRCDVEQEDSILNFSKEKGIKIYKHMVLKAF